MMVDIISIVVLGSDLAGRPIKRSQCCPGTRVITLV